MKKRTIVLFASGMVLLGMGIGGSLAWLQDSATPVTNTFTTSNIGVTLTETTTDYKMVPGHTISKDPVVKVMKDSEDCWVFIKVTESEKPDLDAYIDYDIDPNNWTLLEKSEEKDKEGNKISEVSVYYCKATDITADRNIKVLGYTDTSNVFHPEEVLVNSTVTKEMMDNIYSGKVNEPTLTFQAYAAQLYKDNNTEFTVEEAWDIVNSEGNVKNQPEGDSGSEN